MPRTKGQPPLTRDQIIRTAIELIDRNGLEEASMRRLAKALGVMPMALYYHFKDKGALLHAIIDAVFSECALDPGGSWIERLRSLCRSLRGVARRHPAIFMAAMVHEEHVDSDFVIAEAFLDALASGGLPADRAVRGYNTLVTYVSGFAVDEIAGMLLMFEGAEEALDTLPRERFPQLHAHRTYLTDVDPDAEFEYGLAVLLEGIGAGDTRGERGRR